MNITKYFLDRPKLATLILVFILFAGSSSIVNLPRQDMPNVDFNFMIINTFYPGASPEDVEINVTDPIEDELENVDGIEELSSFSIESMSSIFIELDPDIKDVSQLKEDIRSAVDRVTDLPEEVEERPLVTEMKSTDFPVIEVAIMSERADEKLLRRIAKDLESEIKGIGDVGSIEKIGYRKREVQILCDAEKMEQNQISFAEILTSVRYRNVKLSGGTLESFVDQKKIVTFSEFDDVLDVNNVIIRSNFSGKRIKVQDVAFVKDDFAKQEVICRTNGLNSINLVIKRRGTTDVIKLSQKISEIIEKFKDTYKKDGISVVKVVDYTYYTKSLLSIVKNNALIGFVLVVVSLFIFLNLHSAFWVAIGIPLSILGAYFFLPFFDATTNQLTLITIIMVLGMLVDDAIVIAENINRHREEGKSGREAALIGTKEMFKPVLATITTTILCFVPMYFMSGILGKFIRVIPTVVILTLIMSLFESITLLPVHLSSNSKAKIEPSRWFSRLKGFYANFLNIFLRFRYFTLLFFSLVAIGSFVFFAKNSKFDLFPTEDFDLFYIVMETKMGDSLNETFNKVKDVELVVADIPKDLMMGYKTIVGDHRTDEAASDPSLHEHWSLITIFLHPAAQRYKRSEDIIKELNQKIKHFKGFEKLEVREMQDGPPVGQPITIRLISDDFDLCKKYEKEILDFINQFDGIYDLESSNLKGKDEIRLKFDYDIMAKLGITAIDIADTIRMAYDGKVATTIRKDGEEIDFRMKLLDSQRGNLEVLKNLQILNNQNRLVKIKNFAIFEKGTASQSISHFDGKKAVIIQGKVKNEIITSKKINQLLKDEFEDKINKIPGLRIAFGGEEKETMESMRNFFIAFLCGVLGIYSVLVLLLNSYYQPFLIMIAIPFGFVGIFIAFHVHSLPMSFIGMIGSLGMMGVVVNDSLVMVTFLNHLKEQEKKINTEIILRGAATRLRPVLLTTITTVLGLLPTVYGWGGYEPFLVPMVLAMSWGLLFATFITLILIPVLYSIFCRKYHDFSV